MGEFGTGGTNNEKWDHIFQFLKETDHDWAYWSIDGYKYPDEPEGNYKFIIDNQIELLKFTDRVN